MLRLENIALYQFKNYDQQQFGFNANVVGICGDNGLGKTNLLDTIYFLCFSKSYFTRSDASSVQHGKAGMRIEGNFVRNDAAEKVVCILRENNRKELQRNGEDYKKFSQHIGLFPAVMIAPDDVELIIGSSEIRRKFIDTLLSQLDPDYLAALIDYNKVLQQRNSFLKTSADRGYTDEALLEIFDEQLIKPGMLIFEKRTRFLNQFLPAIASSYNHIAGTSEKLLIEYYSPLRSGGFRELLQTYKQKDLLLQRTTIGIHKDDIEFTLGNETFRQVASQGQRKSLLFALKLAEFEELKAAKGFAPLLLLDDVFEKLDARRMQNLLHRVCVENEGQVFITDTHRPRLEAALSSLAVEYQIISLE
ncbi:DNA replication and repair protein RecF [Segetibacter sp. 3557_3]|uniref:DNA replication/repair protein RecF n=1 Tax=Segetibacter sp. 3557_3 TaxID=2547429 RepID=UPI001058F37F|nr:DNA replication and repair protein RecF [Segetibacter sp. 3557_3]TDH29160.1 DNA replication and repair protein RecF [Segetibacter sp. 3557_3]